MRFIVGLGLMAVVLSGCNTTDNSSYINKQKRSFDSSLLEARKDTLETDKKLSKKAIQNTLRDKEINGYTEASEKLAYHFTIHDHTNDLIVHKFGEDERVSATDKGSWWIAQDKMCTNLQKFFDGKTNCFSVFEQKGHFVFVDDVGEKRFIFKIAGTSDNLLARKLKEKPSPRRAVSTNAIKAWKEKNARAVGELIGYSELCAEYEGRGISKIYVRDVKEKFKGIDEFSKGYDQFASYRVYDRVNLSDCKSVNAKLDEIKPTIAMLPSVQ